MKLLVPGNVEVKWRFLDIAHGVDAPSVRGDSERCHIGSSGVSCSCPVGEAALSFLLKQLPLFYWGRRWHPFLE